MRYATVAGFFLVIFLFGCSSVSIRPKPGPGGVVNPSDNSIRLVDSGLSVTARIQDVAVGGYDIETAIGSFYLAIANNTGRDVDISLENFSLVASSGETLQPLQPEEVNALINPRISSFLPYPFVGFYDVIDLERHKASSAMASERRFTGSGLSGVENLFPIKTGRLNNGSQVSGSLFFKVEIIDEKLLTLKLNQPAGADGKRLRYEFPFAIE